MGAILGCLTRKKLADAKAAPQNPPVPNIDEVDFMAVHAIVFDPAKPTAQAPSFRAG